MLSRSLVVALLAVFALTLGGIGCRRADDNNPKLPQGFLGSHLEADDSEE